VCCKKLFEIIFNVKVKVTFLIRVVALTLIFLIFNKTYRPYR